MQLIDGKAISELVKQEIAAEVAGIVAKGGKRPHLAAILVGHDGGSETYVAAKVKACEVCGFKSSLIRYEADVTEEELLALSRDPAWHRTSLPSILYSLPRKSFRSYTSVTVRDWHAVNCTDCTWNLQTSISCRNMHFSDVLRLKR